MKKLSARIKFYHTTHTVITQMVMAGMDRIPWCNTLTTIRQLREVDHPLGPEW